MSPNPLQDRDKSGVSALPGASRPTASRAANGAPPAVPAGGRTVKTKRPEDAVEAQSGPELVASSIAKFLRSFQALILSTRLYDEHHPLARAAVETAQQHLHEALVHVIPVAIRVEENTLSCHCGPGTDRAPLDGSEMFPAIAQNWRKIGLRSLVFLPRASGEELRSLARLLTARRSAPDDWPALLASQQIANVRANVRIQVQVTQPVLATLVAALVSHGAVPIDSRSSAVPPTLDDLSATLKLLARIEPITRADSPAALQHTAQELHLALADAERRTLSQILGMMSRTAAHEKEPNEQYIARIAEGLLVDVLAAQFSAGRLPIHDVRNLFAAIGEAIERAMAPNAEPQSRVSTIDLPPALAHAASVLIPNVARSAVESNATTVANYAELLRERFWDQLAPREKSTVLRSDDAWCVPAKSLQRYIAQLLGPDRRKTGDAPLREARIVLLSFARALRSEEPRPRRIVAEALLSLAPLTESLWERESPLELDRTVTRALVAETSPGISATLIQLIEKFARAAMLRKEYGRYEQLLTQSLEVLRTENDKHAEVNALVGRLATGEAWQALVDAALDSRPLDPALPRILRRDPTRLVERLGSALAEPGGLNGLAQMSQIVRSCGEPIYGVLEASLYDARSQRSATAVKLLASAAPERLVGALPRALPGWDWNLQDLAVAELSRREGASRVKGAALAFAKVLPEAHELVAPMMIDEIGFAAETSAIPLLIQLASGEVESQRDVFIRIKAVEALGRMHAQDSADVLRRIVRQHQGLMHTEPAGLRAAAEEALALMENRPSSARVRAADEVRSKANSAHAKPRRYLRIPLDRPYPARIEGAVASKADVRIISMGGAFVESTQRLSLGDHVQVDIRAGLRHIRSTAVVRNTSLRGCGIEFLKMPQEDRERLRKLMRRLQAQSIYR